MRRRHAEAALPGHPNGAGRRARRHRWAATRQRRRPLHALRQTALRLPSRPARPARPLHPVDPHRRRQQHYRQLAGRLADIGLISPGSLIRRHTRCGKPGCRCQAEPPQMHGPYWQWTATVDGNTVTRRLTERQADRYREWIANDRQLRQLIQQLRRAAAAIKLILQAEESPDTSPPGQKVNRKLSLGLSVLLNLRGGPASSRRLQRRPL